jgi:phage shock protein A
MSHREDLIKMQDLVAAAISLEQELEEASIAVKQAELQVSAVSTNIDEVKAAIAAVAASLSK